MAPARKGFLTTEQLMRYLGIDPRGGGAAWDEFRGVKEQPGFPMSARIGDVFYYRRADVDAWMAAEIDRQLNAQREGADAS